jgi:hypothetical protein
MTYDQVRQRVQAELDAWATGTPGASVSFEEINQLFEALADACGSLGEELRDETEDAR